MINFMLPGLYEKFELNKFLINLFNDNRHMFIDDLNFYCAYGSFPFSIWDGGRIFAKYFHASKEEIEDMISFYNSQNIKHRLVCTNPVLEEKHLNDEFMNLVMELCEKEDMGEVVVNHKMVEEYILKNYPKYNLISSTTKCLVDSDNLLDELKNPTYRMVCLDYNWNNNFSKLETIPQELRSKCEFLINAICPPGCPNRKKHYALNGMHMLEYGRHYSIDCGITYGTLHPEVFNRKNFINPENINDYVNLGFNNFKLEGRTWPNGDLMGTYIRYLIKPEYQHYVWNLFCNVDIPDYNKK